jgi:hypothetical protein
LFTGSNCNNVGHQYIAVVLTVFESACFTKEKWRDTVFEGHSVFS